MAERTCELSKARDIGSELILAWWPRCWDGWIASAEEVMGTDDASLDAEAMQDSKSDEMRFGVGNLAERSASRSKDSALPPA